MNKMDTVQTLEAGTTQILPLDVTMTNYYRWHAKIYDVTRWTFLFGRQWLLDFLPFERVDRVTVVEVGCGTGFNLRGLAKRYPKAKLVGIDVAQPMLDIAEKECKNVFNALVFKKIAYGTEGSSPVKNPDALLFSYCLTMVNPDWEKLVLQAHADLKTGGYLAVVDFHDSPFSLFRRWMRFNHVRMEGHILPFLKAHFSTIKIEKRRAYLGLWTYFLFVGQK
jgi:S-adenosylmethionine-diacylgycerolhomoserine-N-methlytransferase